ncbi:uncharacterized protein K02A2.6-like, partial [Tachysurus ichikawai]
MELDTGSALSVISAADYKRLFSKIPLQQTSVILKTYTAEKVSPKGKLPVTVNYKENRQQLNLYGLENGGPALFRREWLRKIPLDWHAIKNLDVSHQITNKETRMTLSQIVQNAEPVFQKGIGTLKGIKGTLELKEDTSPKFFKARPVPYAIRPKVEAELDHLVKTGILTKIERSEWATPIVPVIKKGKTGDVRICGDFKVTINPALHAVQYPLPRIEDIFASLSSGEHFSKNLPGQSIPPNGDG